MIKNLTLISLSLIIICVSKISLANENIKFFSKHSSNEELIDLLSKNARDGFYKKLVEKQEFIPEKPIKRIEGDFIPKEHSIAVIDKGVHSVAAEWCGYKPRENGFLIFMQKQKESQKWSEDQLKYIDLLHTETMNFFKPRFDNMSTCENKHKKAIDRFF